MFQEVLWVYWFLRNNFFIYSQNFIFKFFKVKEMNINSFLIFFQKYKTFLKKWLKIFFLCKINKKFLLKFLINFQIFDFYFKNFEFESLRIFKVENGVNLVILKCGKFKIKNIWFFILKNISNFFIYNIKNFNFRAIIIQKSN